MTKQLTKAILNKGLSDNSSFATRSNFRVDGLVTVTQSLKAHTLNRWAYLKTGRQKFFQ